MCGICGVYSRERIIDTDKVTIMNRSLYHRGPDSEGYFFSNDQKAALAMRRLAIQDVQQGVQPVYNEDRSIVAVFNGEIYNFKTLRSDLIKKGHIMSSNSDSEIIPHLFEEYGTKFIEYCNGMFSIALYSNDKLYIFRDRIGIKPLYFAQYKNSLIYASEIKSIVSAYPQLKEIDINSLNSYLTFSYIPEPDSIYVSIKKLLPGHFLVYGQQTFEIIKYWFPEQYITQINNFKNIDEITEEFDDLLNDSVKLRMIADVPLGAFLSGGLDSSAIVSYMNRVSDNIKTFSIGFSGKDHYDETSYAKIVSDCFNTDHYEYTVDENYRTIIEKMMPYIDEPFADSSCIPMYSLAEITHRHVTVCLSGTGSDEILGGYRRYLLDKICAPFSLIPGFSKSVSFLIKDLNVSRETKFQQYLLYLKRTCDISNLSDQEKYYAAQSIFSKESINDIFKDKNNVKDRKIIFKRFLNECNAKSFLQMAQYLDLKIYLPADLLVKEDRMTMAHSLESRVPFLDHRIVEFCLKLPDDMKIRNLSGKYILKKVMDLELPEEIIKRPKHGFAVPVERWFRNGLENELLDLCGSKNSVSSKYFNISMIEGIINVHKTKKQDMSAQLWNILMLELWNLEHHI